jgi:multicomponent Na+:H+ antiporter subunit D
MATELLPTGLFVVGALVAALVPSRLAAATALLTPVVAGLTAFSVLVPGATATVTLMDYDLQLVRADAFNLILVGLFHVAALTAAVFTLDVRDRLQHAAMLLYVGAGTGAVLAGDLISLFFFFELIGLSGTLLILAARTPTALGAGVRYLVFQVAAGVSLLAGLLSFGSATGDWSLRAIGLDQPGGALIMLAFGIKAGFPLVHGWIVEGYSRASLAGLAILVAVTTKVGIYGLARGFAGEGILIGIGTAMAVWPVFYMLVENDLRRVLAYSMMVQLGLMVVAIGVGTELAIDGVAMHIVMDVLFKMALFMALGAVLLRLGTTRADRLGGLWRELPLTTITVAIAVLANAAAPLTGAFVSKKLLLVAIEESNVPVVVWLILVSLSALSMLYLGLRVLWEGFLRPAREVRPAVGKAPANMDLAMLIPVSLLLLTGIFPGLTDILRPESTTYWPLTLPKLVGQLQLILFGLLAYIVARRLGFGLPESRPASWLDADWIYRRGVPLLARSTVARFRSSRVWLWSLVHGLFPQTFRDGRLSSNLGRTWPIGSMALWMAILLATLLLFGLGG